MPADAAHTWCESVGVNNENKSSDIHVIPHLKVSGRFRFGIGKRNTASSASRCLCICFSYCFFWCVSDFIISFRISTYTVQHANSVTTRPPHIYVIMRTTPVFAFSRHKVLLQCFLVPQAYSRIENARYLAGLRKSTTKSLLPHCHCLSRFFFWSCISFFASYLNVH